MKKHILYQILLIALKILLGCSLGFAIVLFFASYSEIVHQEIKKSVQDMFQQSFQCDWDGQLESIDLLWLEVKFKNVHILPADRSDGWSMYVDKFYMSASWLHYLLYGKFSCHTYFKQVVVYEKVSENVSKFTQILIDMFSSQPPSMISFDYITIKQGEMIVQDATGDLQGSYEYNCQISNELDGVHTKLYILDGQCRYKDTLLVHNVFGNFITITPYDNNLHTLYARADFRLSIPALQEKSACFLKGDIYDGRGAFVLSNEDQSFIIEPLKFRFKDHAIPVTCAITMTSDLLQQLAMGYVIIPDVQGSLTLLLKGNLLDIAAGVSGKIQAHNIMYKNNQFIDHASMNFNKEQDGYDIKTFVNSECVFKGKIVTMPDGWNFHITNTVELIPFWMSYWKMASQKGVISGFMSNSLQMQGKYNFEVESVKLQAQAKASGEFACNKNELNVQGSFLDYRYEGIFELSPVPHVVQMRYFNEHETFIDFNEHQDSSQGTVGYIGFNFIKSLLPDQYKSSFSQSGKIDMSGHLQQGSYFADAVVHDAHIKIPSLYNVMHGFKAETEINFMNRSIDLYNLVADLHDGKIRCDHAALMLDAQSQISFIHMPMFLDHVLMSWYKGIFGIISGRLFLSLRDQKMPKLQGNLILDETQLKGNIFSTEFQEHLLGSTNTSLEYEGNCQLDISIQTKDPIIIETSFLQATAHLDFHITNTAKQPDISGVIDLVSGELKFPYKSLFITHGQVLIMPKNSSDPMIEFVAKGKIKRYNITMRATGTMMDQQIHFDSSPYLTEEQIVSLLLIGSAESPLGAVMPAMFMQKLHEIVFGPAISKTNLDVIFNRLLQSFKSIRIYPQFTNQTGRGGVRGVVEVDATERLHGRIDSNLMQLEDTIFEADYALTDDMTVRAIKDGPSTYGGEVEMRWKFS